MGLRGAIRVVAAFGDTTRVSGTYPASQHNEAWMGSIRPLV
jgi:hypothetical protein